VSSDLITAVTEIREHADDYRLAAQYYNGEVGELFTSAAVKRALRGAVGGFDINLARRPVDAVLDRVQILAVAVPNDQGATRRLIDAVWTPNKLGRYSEIVHWGALTYGDAYLIVWPGDDDATVELHYNSPVTTRMFYDPENPRVKSHAAKMWTVGSGDQELVRVNLYYADRVEKWTTKPGNKGKEEVDFEPYEVDGEPWPLPNPYGQVPVFHFRTREPYGRPEHRGAFGPQNAITKLSATLMATVDYQAFPQRYALMAASGADDLFAPDPDDETLAPDAGANDLKASPGTVWKLRGAAKVGQFDPADMDAFLRPLNFYARAMSAATATPLRFLEPSGAVPSGESLRADDAPLTKRISNRQSYFADEWSESLQFASLVLGEQLPAVDIQWRPVQVIDDHQGWQTVLLKMQAGVPFVQAMTEAGYLSELAESWTAPAPAAGEGSR